MAEVLVVLVSGYMIEFEGNKPITIKMKEETKLTGAESEGLAESASVCMS